MSSRNLELDLMASTDSSDESIIDTDASPWFLIVTNLPREGNYWSHRKIRLTVAANLLKCRNPCMACESLKIGLLRSIRGGSVQTSDSGSMPLGLVVNALAITEPI
jgi:hypothetical protein